MSRSLYIELRDGPFCWITFLQAITIFFVEL